MWPTMTRPILRREVYLGSGREIITYGIKTYWLDACEPEMYPLDPDNLRFHNGEWIGGCQCVSFAARAGFL